MAARSKRKQRQQQPFSGNTNGNRPQQSGSSGKGSNSPSSQRSILAVDPAKDRFSFQEVQPATAAEERAINPLMSRASSPQPRPEQDPALEYVDEEPLVYIEERPGSSSNEQPIYAARYIEPINSSGLSVTDIPSPSYDGKDPDISVHNYTVARHFLEQMYGLVAQLDQVVAAEQDDHLHGILLGAQAGFDVAYAHVHRELANLTGVQHG